MIGRRRPRDAALAPQHNTNDYSRRLVREYDEPPHLGIITVLAGITRRRKMSKSAASGRRCCLARSAPWLARRAPRTCNASA